MTYDKLAPILHKYFTEVMENYDQTALLLNSCEKAATYYHSKTAKTAIDTTMNLPPELKLNTDISTVFNKKQLVEQYEHKLSLKLTKDYLVTTVATLDGLMEDLYEAILIEQETEKTEEDIKKMITWREPGLLKDILNRLPLLKTHTNPKGHKLEEYFYTYEHLRQIRHAIIHNKGQLDKRHQTKIQGLESKMNEKQKESVQQFYKDDKVSLYPLTIFVLRYWCLNYFAFLTIALETATDTE